MFILKSYFEHMWYLSFCWHQHHFQHQKLRNAEILFPHFDLRTERYQILFISFYIYLLSAFWKLMFLLICQNDVEQKVGHSDILQQGKLGAEAGVVKVHISYLLRHSTLLSLPFLYFVFNFWNSFNNCCCWVVVSPSCTWAAQSFRVESGINNIAWFFLLLVTSIDLELTPSPCQIVKLDDIEPRPGSCSSVVVQQSAGWRSSLGSSSLRRRWPQCGLLRRRWPQCGSPRRSWPHKMELCGSLWWRSLHQLTASRCSAFFVSSPHRRKLPKTAMTICHWQMLFIFHHSWHHFKTFPRMWRMVGNVIVVHCQLFPVLSWSDRSRRREGGLIHWWQVDLHLKSLVGTSLVWNVAVSSDLGFSAFSSSLGFSLQNLLLGWLLYRGSSY